MQDNKSKDSFAGALVALARQALTTLAGEVRLGRRDERLPRGG